jgi:hypothetical protein
MSRIHSSELLAAGILAATVFATAAAPPHWYLAGSKPSNYETGVDREVVLNARPSDYLKAKSDQDGFGTLMQDFSAVQYVGKRVRFSAFVKSDAVARWAGLWMRVDGKGGKAMSFDNMQNRPINGTTGFQHYDVVLDVPQGATGIFLGVLLDGPGEVWMNSADVEIVGTDIPTTGRSVADAPRNLNFDQL